MKPDEIAKLTKFFRAKFELPSMSVKKRPQKDDSAEVYIGEEFIGVMFVDDDEKIPGPIVLRTRKTFCSNSWLHSLRSYRLLRPSLMCSAVKCRQSAERFTRRRSMSATHQRSGGVHAAAGIMSTPTVRS